MRLIRVHGTACTRVRIEHNGKRQFLVCAIDTGAVRTLLPPNAITLLGIPITGHANIATVSGMLRVPTAQLELQALETTRSISVVVAELPAGLPFRGLLGLDFFEGRRLTLDFAGGTVELD